MRIFDVILNGDDAKEFCAQSTDFKINWIRTYTNQRNMELIMDYINNPPKNDDCGCGCGGAKAKAEIKEIIPEIPEVKSTEVPDYEDDEKLSFSQRRRFKKE